MKSSFKKSFSLILTICLIIGCLPFSASAVSTTYSSQKALQYAKNHWNDGNELCAGFVSNCLKSGGLVSWNRECSNLYSQLCKEVVNGAKIASIQYLKTSGNYIRVADNKGKVSKGDVLFWLCSGCPSDTVGGPYQHTALISDVSGTYVKVYQHNGAVNNQAAYVGTCYECGRPYSDMVVVHFNSSAASSPKVAEYFSCEVEIHTTQGKRVDLFDKPTDSSPRTYFDLGQTAFSNRSVKLSNGNIYYEIQAIENGKVVTLWLNAKSNGIKIVNKTGQISEGVYVIQAGVGKNLVLDCEKGNQKAGSNILSWTYHGADNQRIRVIQCEDGNYELQMIHSGLVLDVASASNKSGANVIQWDRNNGLNQRWKIVSAGDGWYYIISALSGMSLDISGGSGNPGSNVIVYQPHQGANQRFKFIPA